jgi:tetratricopeptide (TPR) repeat protein
MDPARESTWKWYLVGLFLDGPFKELEAALERARVAAPGAPAVRSMGAHLAIMKRGDLAAAEAELEAVLAIEPDHPLAHYGLGVLCHLRGDLEGAERHLKAELETNPRASFARKVLVGIYKDSERADEAAAVVDECLDRNPRDALCRWLSESLKR